MKYYRNSKHGLADESKDPTKDYLNDDEFEEIMETPAKSYKDYSGYFNSELHNWVRKMIFKMHHVRKSIFRV